MTKKQVEKFVQKISASKIIKIKYVGSCDEGWNGSKKDGDHFAASDAVAVMNGKNIEILINKKSFNKLSDAKLKTILLHEVGHFVVYPELKKQKLLRSVVANELYAQVWAIDRAYRLGMYKVFRQCIKVFENWEYADWNSSQRRYKMAASIFNEHKQSILNKLKP